MLNKATRNDLRLNADQRRYLADKLAGTANLILGGLAVGQILWEKPFQPWLFILGLAIYVLLIITGLVFLKEKGQDGSERT